MITIVIGYFVAGAIVSAGLLIMNKKAGNWHGWGMVGYALAILPFWPVYTVGFTRWALHPNETRCFWCGHVSHSDAEVVDHIRACNKHPMRVEIDLVTAERDTALAAGEAMAMLAGEYKRQLRDDEVTRMLARYGKEVEP